MKVKAKTAAVIGPVCLAPGEVSELPESPGLKRLARAGYLEALAEEEAGEPEEAKAQKPKRKTAKK